MTTRRRWLIALPVGVLLALLLAAAMIVILVAALLVLWLPHAGRDWPEDAPALAAPAPPFAEDPAALEALLAIVEATPRPDSQALGECLDPQGAPPPASERLPTPPPPEVQHQLAVLGQASGLSLPLIDLDAPERQNLMPALHFARLLLCQAWDKQLTGDADGALLDMVYALRLGALMEHSGGDMSAVMFGVAIGQQALDEILELLDADPPPSAEGLALLAQELELSAGLDSAMAAAIVSDCQLFERFFVSLQDIPAAQRRERLQGVIAATPGASLLFDAAGTIAEQRLRCHALQQAALQPRASRQVPVVERLFENEKPQLLQYVDNPLGRLMLDLGGMARGSMVEVDDRLLTRRALARAALAARRYQADHDGAVPPSLEALVPGYLPQVPMDPYDEQPLRYDAEKAQVSSAWADAGVDEGEAGLLMLGL